MSAVVTDEEQTVRRRPPVPASPGGGRQGFWPLRRGRTGGGAPRTTYAPGTRLTIVALMVPAVVALLALVVVPIVKMVVLSFQEPNIFTRENTWVGLANYREILGDSEFWSVVGKSIAFALTAAGATIVIGLTIATAMLHMHKALRLAVSTALVLVWATPQFIGATVWRWFFDTEFGVVNWFAFKVGLIDDQTQSWVTNVWTAFAIVFIVVVWQAVPFVTLAIYGALLTVPSELHEAAQMDGAGSATVFRRITVPLIAPVLMIATLLSIIWDFRVLTQIAFTTQGAPYGQTNLLGPYIVQTAIGGREYGLAAAIGVVVTALLMGLAWIYVRMMRKEDV